MKRFEKFWSEHGPFDICAMDLFVFAAIGFVVLGFITSMVTRNGLGFVVGTPLGFVTVFAGVAYCKRWDLAHAADTTNHRG